MGPQSQALHDFDQPCGIILSRVRRQARQDAQTFADHMEILGGKGTHKDQVDHRIGEDHVARDIDVRDPVKGLVNDHQTRRGRGSPSSYFFDRANLGDRPTWFDGKPAYKRTESVTIVGCKDYFKHSSRHFSAL